MKSTVIFVLKTTVSICSLYIVSRTIAWAEVGDVLQQARYPFLVFALVIFWTAQVFSALRCTYIARVLGARLDIKTALRAHFVGLWFNQVMPTGLGGDVIKTALLSKPLGLGAAIRIAILDRLSGLLFLLVVTAIMLPLYANLFPAHPRFIFTLGLTAVAGGLTIVLCAWVAHRITNLPTLNPIYIKLIQIFSDVWSFNKGFPLWEQVWTSAIVHFNGIITYALLGLALGIEVNWITFLLVVPVIFLISLIPVSFAGWGLRETGAVWMFGMVGVTSEYALALSVCFGLLLLLAGLPGLLLFNYNNSLIRKKISA